MGVIREMGRYSHEVIVSNRWRWKWAVGLFVGLMTVLGSGPSPAQITPDRTLGTENSRVNSGVNIKGQPGDRIEGGAQRGSNLFHSFFDFNVNQGQRVYFANPTGIANILSRVTGQNASNILGTLGVEGSANLFLLNPNGILFGPNAQLDIRGSFVASTAEKFVFGDGSEFSATNPQTPPLLTVNITPGLQYGKPVGDINQAGNLAVPAGQSLTLFGSTVTNTGTLTAPSGTVQVLGSRVALLDQAHVDVSSPTGGGTVLIGGDFQGQGPLPSSYRVFVAPDVMITADALAAGDGGKVIIWSDEATRFYGNIRTRGGSESGNGGFVEVSGKQFLEFNGQADTLAPYGLTGTLLLDPTNITVIPFPLNIPILLDLNNQFADPGANNFINSGTINAATTNIILQATNTIIFDAGINITRPGVGLTAQAGNRIVVNQSITTGDGGNLRLIAGAASGSPTPGTGTLTIGRPDVRIFVRSAGGNLLLQADQNIVIDRAEVSTLETRPSGNPGMSPPLGSSGTVTIETGRLVLQNNGRLVSAVQRSGNGGDINIRANEVDLFDTAFIDAGANIIAGANIPIGGRAGDITINAQRLLLQDQAGIYAGTFTTAAGGNITLQVSEIELSGSGTFPDFGIFTSANPGSTGKAGNLNIQAQQLVIRNGKIETSTFGIGDAGNLTIDAQRVLLQDQAAILSQTSSSGKGGDVTLRASELELSDSSISSSTTSVGPAGNITIQVDQGIMLSDSSQLSARTSNLGKAGDITLNSPILTVMGNSEISAETQGSGQGGSITVNAPTAVNLLRVQDFFPVLSVETSGAGQAGNIEINTPSLSLSDKARITATATATSTNLQGGGSISLNASNMNLAGTVGVFAETQGVTPAGTLRLSPYNHQPDLGITLTPNSKISASTSGSGNGGDLILTAPKSITIAGPGQLAVETSSTGNAGNINVETQRLTLKDGVELSASTSSSGNAGDINLTANTLDLSSGAKVSTNTSGSGQAGNINVNVTDRLQLSGEGTGLFASTAAGSSGPGGNIFIDPQTVLVQDRASIAVDSQGSGQGGNITLQAGRLELRDFASISAKTASSQGGNITLDVQDLLLLRRNSSISATAGTAQASGDGGNIRINAPFVIAVLGENSDITANAFTGKGGRIDITAQGIYGLQVQSRLTPFSDITASSELGVQGEVNLNTPDVDPSRGLQPLPTGLVDQSGLINQRCARRNDPQTASSFYITGRGGLPYRPGDLPSPHYATGEVRSVAGATASSNPNPQASRSSGTPTVTAPSEPTAIVEATTWRRDKNGVISLVAEVPQSPSLQPPDCPPEP